MIAPDWVLDVLLPLVSVLVGAAITYALNIRSRTRAEVAAVYHEAISAVAIAIASSDFIGHVGWGDATPAEEAVLSRQMGRESTERYLRGRRRPGSGRPRLGVRPIAS